MEERWKQSFDLLSLGTFPDGFDKSQKLNLRRYASKFKLNGEYLKYMLVYNVFDIILNYYSPYVHCKNMGSIF